MARIRTIKPEFWRHEDLSALPAETHMLAAALLNYSDDEGYFNANPKLVQAECCPLREPSVSIHDSLNHLVAADYIELGEGEDGKRYGRVKNFGEHQRINRPTPSKISTLNIVWEPSPQTHTLLTEPSPPERKGTGNREQGREHETRAKVEREFRDEFWPAYPHKVGKADALKAFTTARRDAELPEIMAGLALYVATKPPDRSWCNPATFLRQQRWLDEPAPAPNGQSPPRRDQGAETARVFDEMMREAEDRDGKRGSDFEASGAFSRGALTS